ncbi:hypothetical protein EU537_10630 [Candidatus Thorarchaeota archaeon]|nr:MAG: hypothetical protein EU537_10630 [Candidatus Thorarchaeota archaeon]
MSSIREFQERYAYSFDIRQPIGTSDKTSLELEPEDLREAASRIILDQENSAVALSEYAKTLGPAEFSLFVVNEEIIKIMKKKILWSERILPMVTCPFYYWSKAAEGKDNPYGVVKEETGVFDTEVDSIHRLHFSGAGGDFCGIVEGGVAMNKPKMRPVIAPSFPRPTKPIPRYEFATIEVFVDFNGLECEIYPIPKNNLDYTFSESPKVLRQRGMELKTKGERVALSVNNSRPVNLRGNVTIYIARNYGNSNKSRELFHHVWMFAIEQLIMHYRDV